jgi:hypothetical protein
MSSKILKPNYVTGATLGEKAQRAVFEPSLAVVTGTFQQTDTHDRQVCLSLDSHRET